MALWEWVKDKLENIGKAREYQEDKPRTFVRYVLEVMLVLTCGLTIFYLFCPDKISERVIDVFTHITSLMGA